MFEQIIVQLAKPALKRHRTIDAWLKAADVSPSTYYRWRTGKTKPSMRVLERLKKASSIVEPA